MHLMVLSGVSPLASRANYRNVACNIGGFNQAQLTYLQYHREHVSNHWHITASCKFLLARGVYP